MINNDIINNDNFELDLDNMFDLLNHIRNIISTKEMPFKVYERFLR